ncbi:MAG: ABC transporter permease [Culicoidibacterales bacterium]
METINKELFTFAKQEYKQSDEITTTSRTYAQDVVRELFRNKATVAAILMLVLILLLAYLSPFFSNSDVTTTDLKNVFALPSAEHWFGTDEIGRDLWARTWAGVKFSLSFATVSTLIASSFGIMYGAISGFSNTVVDNIMQAIIEYMENIPLLQFLGIIFMIINPNFWTFLLVMSIFTWPSLARLTRGQVLKYRNHEFILASEVLGRSNVSILFRHVIPNIIGVIAVSMTVSIPSTMFFETSLSYLGLGMKPPTATVGLLISDARSSLIRYPHVIIPLAIIMGLMTIAFVFLANGIRDAFDPNVRGE